MKNNIKILSTPNFSYRNLQMCIGDYVDKLALGNPGYDPAVHKLGLITKTRLIV